MSAGDVLLAVARVLAFLLGLGIVVSVFLSAVCTFVLPRAAPDRLTRIVFLFWRSLFDLFANRARTFNQKDRILALYAPFTLLSFPPVWLTIITLGFTLIYWALEVNPLGEAFLLSGSSILTLGFATADTLLLRLLAFTEATLGLIMVALLISYLPTMYNAFSERETAVTLLDVRAGTPPTAVNMMLRLHRIGRLHDMTSFWERWEIWFAQIEERHTSLTVLVFFRSPQPEYNWLTASAAVLDSAALYTSTIDVPRDPQADLCIRAGYLALRRIADFFGIPYDPAPNWENDISISRAEFDEACAELAADGVPLKPDLDQAWRDFKGWRVNYEEALLGLCAIIVPPEAPWSSDRAPAYVPPRFWRLGRQKLKKRAP